MQYANISQNKILSGLCREPDTLKQSLVTYIRGANKAPVVAPAGDGFGPSPNHVPDSMWRVRADQGARIGQLVGSFLTLATDLLIPTSPPVLDGPTGEKSATQSHSGEHLLEMGLLGGGFSVVLPWVQGGGGAVGAGLGMAAGLASWTITRSYRAAVARTRRFDPSVPFKASPRLLSRIESQESAAAKGRRIGAALSGGTLFMVTDLLCFSLIATSCTVKGVAAILGAVIGATVGAVEMTVAGIKALAGGQRAWHTAEGSTSTTFGRKEEKKDILESMHFFLDGDGDSDTVEKRG